jgi:transcriptional regulator with XRE-family HTH domain
MVATVMTGHAWSMKKEDRHSLAQRVGATVRSGRKAKGLSQEALASAIEISVVTLSNIERAENVPTLGVYLRLFRELDLDVEELAQTKDPEPPGDPKRQQLEAEANSLLRDIELRDLELLVALAKNMLGR